MSNYLDLKNSMLAERVVRSLGGEKYYASTIPRIDPDRKKIWVAALRSEEYKDRQGMYMLKTTAGNLCCLGVYCEVTKIPSHSEFGSYRDETFDVMTSGMMTTFGTAGHTSAVILPDFYNIPFVERDTSSCVKWDSFNGDETIFDCEEQGPVNSETGEPVVPQHQRLVRSHMLPSLNDSGQFNFAQIADIIDYFL